MKSTKKGNNYYFGMKSHTGVDAGSGAVVNTAYTAANEHDITQAVKCYREDDDVRYGDVGFIGVEKRRKIELSDIFNQSKRIKINKSNTASASVRKATLKSTIIRLIGKRLLRQESLLFAGWQNIHTILSRGFLVVTAQFTVALGRMDAAWICLLPAQIWICSDMGCQGFPHSKG